MDRFEPHIDAQPGQRVVIAVRAGSRAGFDGGIALLVIGGIGSAVGLALLFVASAEDSLCTALRASHCSTSDDQTKATLALVAGVAVAVVGVILVATNATSTVTVRVDGGRARPSSRPETTWLRTPVWLDPSRDARGAAPREMGVPLFTQRFRGPRRSGSESELGFRQSSFRCSVLSTCWVEAADGVEDVDDGQPSLVPSSSTRSMSCAIMRSRKA